VSLTLNKSAGCRAVSLDDDATGTPFPMLVLYPSSAPEQPERFGPYVLPVAMDGPIDAGTFPLVVISHGSGGSHLVYRNLGAHLARQGFVVAMPEHPRNNRNNNDHANTVDNLINRPRHLRVVMDWALSPGGFGGSLKPGAAAIIGHSMGGYTALCVAGGRPTALAHETPEREPRALSIPPDGRVKALVLLAPATPWFMAEGALKDVRVPILMLTGEKDGLTPAMHAEFVKRGLTEGAQIEHRVIPNAGHYAFLSPFPEAMTNPAFPPSQDPEGFDRARFHEEMNADIEAFLRRVLSLD
jgi:predicted dienelactone hydrolase